MLQKWINNILDVLPGADKDFFQRVWKEQRLLFDGKQGTGENTDYLSACLVASALRSGGRFMVVLPDTSPHRPAFL
ncbi:hypothetical protein ACQ9LF_13860, partial [Anaerohalosphaeraceae bacterium U12dextr]